MKITRNSQILEVHIWLRRGRRRLSNSCHKGVFSDNGLFSDKDLIGDKGMNLRDLRRYD